MAIPPNIPTSFVPKQAIQAGGSHVIRRHGANPINIVAPAILGVAVLAAGAVYGYQHYLTRAKAARAVELTAKEQSIDQTAVQEFIRLRDRLSAGQTLLAKHVTLSQFFTRLESMTLQSVRFQDLKITVGDDRTATVQMTGEARSFNALAAQSTAFSSDPDIGRAIFSGVRQGANGTVSFSLSATLASKLVTGGMPSIVSPASLLPPPPVATTTVTAPAPQTGTTTSTSVAPAKTATTTATTTPPRP